MIFIKSRYTIVLSLIVALAVTAAAVFGSAQKELSFRINRISDRVLIFAPGEYADPAATNVIVTEEGLILVDTGLAPTLAEWTRREIKKELGRDDVVMVINTHFHFDHTDGNQVYAGAEFVGHADTPAAMEQFMENRDSFLASRKGRMDRLRSQLENAAPGSDEALGAKQSIQMEEIFLRDLQSTLKITPPTLTLDDKLIIHKADLEIRLYAFGNAHTHTDIVVHIPALKVLFVGDLFHPAWLSVGAPGPSENVPRWLYVLETVLKNKDDIETVIGGHGHIFTPQWLSAQLTYTKDIWTAVGQAKEEQKSFADFISSHPLKDYAYMEPYFDLIAAFNLNRHQQICQFFWNTELESASE